MAVSGRFDPTAKTDMLVVIGGFGTRYAARRRCLQACAAWPARRAPVGGVEAGTWLVGRAGLLEGRAATTHWEDMEDFAAAFPGADVRPDRYVIDGPVFTSGGASPTFDLMLHLIRTRLGMAVALDVASVFIYDQARAATDAQPLVSLGRLDGYDPRLAQAIRLMEAHVDQPLTIAAIARRAGVTARTLESIFRKSIGETPGAYYLRLRLNARAGWCRYARRHGRHRGADGLFVARHFPGVFGASAAPIGCAKASHRGGVPVVARSGAHRSQPLSSGASGRPIRPASPSSAGHRHQLSMIDADLWTRAGLRSRVEPLAESLRTVRFHASTSRSS